jgi:hypothetical protein
MGHRTSLVSTKWITECDICLYSSVASEMELYVELKFLKFWIPVNREYSCFPFSPNNQKDFGTKLSVDFHENC